MRMLCLWFLLALPAIAAPPFTAGDVRMPKAEVAQAAPAPVSKTTHLDPSLTFIIESQVELLILDSPKGTIKVTPETGPMTVKAKFVDNPTKTEKRTFTWKYLYTIEPVVTGKCELIVIPLQVGVIPKLPNKDADHAVLKVDPTKQIIRRDLDVVAAEPEPGPTPVPVPVPVVDDFQKKLQAAFKADGATKEAATRLASLYRLASKTTAKDTGLATWPAMVKELQDAVKGLGVEHGSLDKTARVIADEVLNPAFSKVGTLDEPTRAAIAAAFTRISIALDGVK